MDRTNRYSVIERALSSFALLLILLAGWAVERLQASALLDRMLARLVLAGVATIGWTADRLPWPARRRVGRGGTTHSGLRPRHDHA